jgi:hypothetical protein
LPHREIPDGVENMANFKYLGTKATDQIAFTGKLRGD